LATTALVAATSLAFAANHGHLPKGQTPAVIKQLREKSMPGVVLGSRNLPIAVRAQKVAAGAHGKPAVHVPGGGGYSNFSKSKNALFLSWFGWFVSNRQGASGPYSYSYCYSYNSTYSQCLNYANVTYSFSYKVKQSAAQPFNHVASAKSISVGSEGYDIGGGYGSKGKVGIYSNSTTCGTPYGYSSSTPASCPGAAVAGASGTFSGPSYTGLCCSGLETVNFNQTSLSKKKQYWVVMSANGKNNWLVWNGQDSDFTQYPWGEDYKVAGSSKFHETVVTQNNGNSSTYHDTYTFNTHGWVHVNPFTFEEQQAAFSVN
jgi:hypothetical protein